VSGGITITFFGVRGSNPCTGPEFERYGGHSSCVVLEAEGQLPIVLDMGTGLRPYGMTHDGDFHGTVLLSHLHWDHMQGLPFFPAGDREGSEVAMVVPGQEDGSDPLTVLDRAMSPPFFPIGAGQLRGAWTFDSLQPGESEHAGFHVLAREIPHKGGRTFGYRVSRGGVVMTYMPDHCPTAFGPGPDGTGEYHEAALELARESDLLIHDAQLLRSELAAEAMTGHACGDYALELARRAGAKGVLLFHHRPNRTDDELDRLAESFSGDPPVSLARQGSTLRL
jgi:phosphoribosyl 1,2-cyclic phosphodiesterase